MTGEVSTDGRLACVRADSTRVLRWLLAEGMLLEHSGTPLAWLSATASASCAGDTVHLSRSDIAFEAWAPDAIAVVAPSGPVAFTRAGDLVRSPASASETSREPPPLGLEVASMHPGPGRVRLRLRTPRAGPVRLRVLDVRGRVVATLVDGTMAAGEHSLDWTDHDGRGARAGPGVYIVLAETPTARAALKLVLTP
jgi:hypothetical protein